MSKKPQPPPVAAASAGQAAPVTKPEPSDSSLAAALLGLDVPVFFLVSGGLLYWLGSAYISAYFSSFGLAISDFAFDAREIMLFAAQTFTPLSSLLWGVLILICLATMGRIQSAKDSRIPLTEHFPWRWRLTVLSLFLIVAIVLHLLSAAEGRQAAARDISANTSHLPGVRLALDPARLPADSFFNDPIPDHILDEYCLLARGRDGYYLFKPLPPAGGRAPALPGSRNIHVLLIPGKSVLAMEVATGWNTQR